MALNINLFAIFYVIIVVGGDAAPDKSWDNTTGTWTEFTASLYHINKTWFLLYFVSVIVLLMCAVANVILRSLIHDPDFFGTISAMTRDSLGNGLGEFLGA
jgi:hypothetical protein